MNIGLWYTASNFEQPNKQTEIKQKICAYFLPTFIHIICIQSVVISFGTLKSNRNIQRKNLHIKILSKPDWTRENQNNKIIILFMLQLELFFRKTNWTIWFSEHVKSIQVISSFAIDYKTTLYSLFISRVTFSLLLLFFLLLNTLHLNVQKPWKVWTR